MPAKIQNKFHIITKNRDNILSVRINSWCTAAFACMRRWSPNFFVFLLDCHLATMSIRRRISTCWTESPAGKTAVRRPLATALTQGAGRGWLAIYKLNRNYISIMLNLTSLTSIIVHKERTRWVVREGIERVLCHRHLHVYLSATARWYRELYVKLSL